MKYLFINSVAGYGSTGKIVVSKCRELMQQGHQCAIAWGRYNLNSEGIETYQIGTKMDVYLHAIGTRLWDAEGFGSKRATKRFIAWMDEYRPDVVWLHNLHGYYINVEILFEYIKAKNIPVIWTLHDCWAFTGHCAHFSYEKCEQWKTRCKSCVNKGQYPACIGKSRVKSNYERKKKAFTNVNGLKIVTPSKWLKGLVTESFLKEYPVEVQYNTIDESVFAPTEGDFRKKHQMCEKTLLLGVASVWSNKKGLDDFVKLSGMLDKQYAIILVGVDKKQKKQLETYCGEIYEGADILCIERTNSVRELAGIYTVCDIFLNLTYEDTYPTTNLEAQACGTPCVTYCTGGSPESVPPENVVEQGNLDALVRRIKEIERGKIDGQRDIEKSPVGAIGDSKRD